MVAYGEAQQKSDSSSIIINRTASDTNICLLNDNNGSVTSAWIPAPGNGQTYYDLLSDLLENHSNLIWNGDYITVKDSNNETFDLVANVDTYANFSDGNNGTIGHHIDFISKTLYKDESKLRSNDTNNGSSTYSNQPFMSSSIVTSFLEARASRLPADLRAHIVNKRCNAPVRTDDGGYDTGTAWVDLGSNSGGLWLPFYREIWGRDWGQLESNPSIYCETSANLVQYPSLNGDALGQRVKYCNGSADDWWTASTLYDYSAYFMYVLSGGYTGYYNPTYAIGIPLCFRFK